METLAALLVLNVAAFVTSAEQLACSDTVQCLCGSTGNNVTFCAEDAEHDLCSRLSKCLICLDGLDRCLECEDDKKDGSCSPETGQPKLSRQKRQNYNTRTTNVVNPRKPPTSRYQQRPNQGYSTGPVHQRGGFCPELSIPKLGSIRCISSNQVRTCVGRCLPGYSFENLGPEYEITLTCTNGYYTPLRKFPPCKSGGYCDLIVQGSGSFNCTAGMEGTRCDIICNGRYVGRYFCYPGRLWHPTLPYCMLPKVTENCECEYGGWCDQYGNCVCPVGRTGRYCEIIVIEKQTCSDPGFVTNGFRRYPDETDASVRQMFEEGDSVVYGCTSEEYALQGSSLLTCRSDGTWSKPLPKCVKTAEVVENYCQNPGSISNGKVVYNPPINNPGRGQISADRFPGGGRLQYSCNNGYIMEGIATLICLPDGWSAPAPSCSKVSYCPNPGPIINGKVAYYSALNTRRMRQGFAELDIPEFPEGGRLKYTCDRDYVMEGAESLTCQSNGRWSTPPPSCGKEVTYCPNPGPISNGKITYHPPINGRSRRQGGAELDDPEFPEGGRLHYICDRDYVLEGPESLTCQPNGRWSAPPPFCGKADPRNIKYCVNPGPILNGRIRYFSIIARPRTVSTSLVTEDTPEYPEGTTLEYRCGDGYIMEGAFNLKCQSTGQWSDIPPKCVPDCGRSILGTTRRILHGNRTVVGEWPWVVAIGIRQNNFTQLICGGAVLNTQTIATAAHCLSVANQFILYFGKYHRSDSLDDAHVLVRTSDRLIVHPEYNNTTMDNDIALVKFKPKINFTDRILPICLPSSESTAYNLVSGRSGYVTGWGWTERRLTSEELLMAKLPYVSNDECTDSFRRNIENFNGSLTQNMFCAGYKKGGSQATCRGDSGAPFVFYDTVVERFILEGLVSFGIEGQCGQPGLYSVFTKVYHFLPWIYRNLGSIT